MRRYQVRLLALVVSFFLLVSLFCITGCKKGPEEGLKDPSGTPVQKIPNDKKFTYDDVLYGEYVSEMAIAPDGKSVAWCKDFCEPGMETRAKNLFLADLEDGSTSQLTSFDGAVAALLKWSPDGRMVAFLSDAPARGGQAAGAGVIQVWAVEPDGGNLAPLTQLEQGVEDFAWKDSGTILYTAEDGQKASEAEPGDDTIHESEYCDAPVRLFEMSVASGISRKLTRNDDRIINLTASHDGKYAFYVRTKSKGNEIAQTYYGDIPFTNHLLDLEAGKETTIFKDVTRMSGTVWSPDSSTLYIADMQHDDKFVFSYTAKVRARDIQAGKETLIDLQWGRGLELMFPFGLPTPPIEPTQDGFIAILADGCNPRIARYTRSGSDWKLSLLEGEHQGNIFYVDTTADGKTICYEHSTASKPPQIYTATLTDSSITEPREITDLNPDFREKLFARSESITWSGARGDPIEGMLFYPEGYEPGKTYPLMVVIHGGPFECDKDRWMSYQWIDPYHILSQKGAFALAPNYHGSTGYGKTSIDFAGSIADGHWYELATEDIRNGIERLVELGMVDEDRLGTMGWSGGSILSNALIVKDQRFKVASCGAGGAEWVSQWGQMMVGDAFVTPLLGKDPIENPGLYKDPSQAPFFDAGRVKTPTIMFQPAADVNVVPAMTWITYRGIQKHSDAPVELFVFPGEPHVMGKLTHQRRKLVEEQKWFDKYFFK